MYRRLDQILEQIQKQRKRPALAQSRLPNTTQNIVRLDHHRDQSEPTYSCFAEVVRGIYRWMEMDTCFFGSGLLSVTRIISLWNTSCVHRIVLASEFDTRSFPRFGFSLRLRTSGTAYH